MPRTQRLLSSTNIYHVVLRGIDRQIIFQDNKDFEKFIRLLSEYKEECNFKIYAWCLMTNHVHLLVRTYDVPLGTIFKKIGVSYSYYFNVKYDRVGHLFQDRFSSEPVETERYFLAAIKYIHANPVNAGMVCKAADYEYSSYNEYDEMSNFKLTDTKMPLKIFGRANILTDSECGSDNFLDVREERTVKYTDEQAQKIVEEVCGSANIIELQSFERNTKNKYAKELVARGVMIRQISRLTGWSRTTIQNAVDSE